MIFTLNYRMIFYSYLLEKYFISLRACSKIVFLFLTSLLMFYKAIIFPKKYLTD